MNENSLNKAIKCLLVALLIIILAIIATLIALYVVALDVGYVYAILIDAGSTSSKITAFKWRDWPFEKNGYVEEVNLTKVEPGISSFHNNPDGAFKQLRPHIENISKTMIPSAAKNPPRLYLAATAGMRILELDNPLQAEAILEDLRLNLPRSGVKVSNPYSDVRTMSGRDEGINAWITVNYLDLKLGSYKIPPEPEHEMVGALDLGGASAQITFVPKSNAPAPYTSTRYLYGTEYYVYSYSHLCFGKSVSQKRIWAEIIGSQSSSTIQNPCLLKNYQLDVTTSGIFAAPCVTSKYAIELVGSELIPNVNLPKKITFLGTGDPGKCREFTKKMFVSRPCSHESCMFPGVYRPPLRGKFNAFSGYTFVIDFLQFPSKGKNLTRSEVKAKVDEFCQRNWEDIVASYPSKDLFLIAQYCVDGIYIDALLSNYGFEDSESWRDIIFASKVSGITVSWAPGYVIDATGMVDSESPKIDLGFTAFVASVVVLGVLFLIVLVIIILFAKNKIGLSKKSENNYGAVSEKSWN